MDKVEDEGAEEGDDDGVTKAAVGAAMSVS
jgi:hypothetical protein